MPSSCGRVSHFSGLQEQGWATNPSIPGYCKVPTGLVGCLAQHHKSSAAALTLYCNLNKQVCHWSAGNLYLHPTWALAGCVPRLTITQSTEAAQYCADSDKDAYSFTVSHHHSFSPLYLTTKSAFQTHDSQRRSACRGTCGAARSSGLCWACIFTIRGAL